MLPREEKLRLKTLIADTVVLLCKNGLMSKLKGDLVIEGLIGISLEENDLMLVSINETLRGSLPIGGNPDISSYSDHEQGAVKCLKRPIKRKNESDISLEDEGTVNKFALIDIEPEDIENTSHPFYPLPHFNDTSTPNVVKTIPNMSQKLNLNSSQLNITTISSTNNVNSDVVLNTSSGEIINSNASIKNEHNSSSNNQLIMVKQEDGKFEGSLSNSLPLLPGADQLSSQIGIVSTGDANQEIELVSGTGVFIGTNAYQQLQYIDKGTKLVRKLVREIFPDVHLLANSSCKGRGSQGGLDSHKVEVIKDFSRSKFPDLTEDILLTTINHICIEARRLLRTRHSRSLQKLGSVTIQPPFDPQQNSF